MRIATAPLTVAIALVLAGCDGDEDTTEATPSPEQNGTTIEATLSPKQELDQIGDKWAPLFAAAPHPRACAEFDEQEPYREVAAKYMAQPACEWLDCDRADAGRRKNCTPVSAGFQKSFAEATVQDVAIKGNRAAAKFSNGEVVAFVHDPVEQPEDELAPRWLIVKIGGNAGSEFFE